MNSMTTEEARAWRLNLITTYTGTAKVFKHCGQTWNVSEVIPDAITCPVCDAAIKPEPKAKP